MRTVRILDRVLRRLGYSRRGAMIVVSRLKRKWWAAWADPVDLQQSGAWRASRRAARRYQATGNALYAWEAAGIALAAGVPMPRAVLAYVTRAARQLGEQPKARITQPARHVFKCLEIAGPGPSAFERRRRYEVDRAIAQIADSLRHRLGLSPADALERAAEDAGRNSDSVTRQARKRKKLAEILLTLSAAAPA